MVGERGEIWWVDSGEPRGSSPGYERPVLIIQSDLFNQTKMKTCVVAMITTNLRLANLAGNILLSTRTSGLTEESVLNVSQIFTVDRQDLLNFVGTLSERKMEQIDKGLRLILSLPKI